MGHTLALRAWTLEVHARARNLDSGEVPRANVRRVLVGITRRAEAAAVSVGDTR